MLLSIVPQQLSRNEVGEIFASGASSTQGAIAALKRVERLVGMMVSAGEQRIGDLERRLIEVERQNARLQKRLESAEQVAHRFSSLHVAVHQLHTTLDAAELGSRLREIMVDLLGARAFALVLRAPGRAVHPVPFGSEPARARPLGFTETDYLAGHPLIDAALDDRTLRACAVAPHAVVSLVLRERVVGALVVLELLPHRKTFADGDLDAIDVLAQHVTTALVTVGCLNKDGHQSGSKRAGGNQP